MARLDHGSEALQAAPQLPLGLEPTAAAASESALRAAFHTLKISRRLTFEQAMASAVYAICIRNLAEATARRVNGASYEVPRFV